MQGAACGRAFEPRGLCLARGELRVRAGHLPLKWSTLSVMVMSGFWGERRTLEGTLAGSTPRYCALSHPPVPSRYQEESAVPRGDTGTAAAAPLTLTLITA